MALSQADIASVIVSQDGPELVISWVCSNPTSTHFQVYVGRRLTWVGTRSSCRVPLPSDRLGLSLPIDVGSVAPTESYEDFSATLASWNLGGAARIRWLGGSYLDETGNDDVTGFRIYRSPAPGLPVSRDRPVAVVSAYPGGRIADGFGYCGFGQGGFGRAATAYEWSCDGLPSGSWQFAVVPFNRPGGECGVGRSLTLDVVAAPSSPCSVGAGANLKYRYSGVVTRLVSLDWSPNPI